MKFHLWLEDEQQPNLLDMIEDVQGWQAITEMLTAAGVDYEFPSLLEKILVFDYGNNRYVIDDEKYPEPKDADEWISERSWRNDTYKYVEEPDFNEEFWWWNAMPLYHGTTEDDWEDIQASGKLQPEDRTRGTENTGTGAAIFTSSEYTTAAHYYDVVVEIDVPAMKQDGYMPRVSKELPVAEAEHVGALAHAIGLEDYQPEWESGIDAGTVVFYDDIPLKYIQRIK